MPMSDSDLIWPTLQPPPHHSRMCPNRTRPLSGRVVGAVLPRRIKERVGVYCPTCGKARRLSCGFGRHLFGRFRWALRTARHAEPKTHGARLRLLWHDFVRHALLNRGGERCQDCGRPTGGWLTTNEHWLRVVGSSSGLLCRPCFDAREQAACG
jgi:hypothetical protein